MKTINFYSYKGGVGRTLLTSQVARILAALGKKVIVADFDFDAPGIPSAFNVDISDITGGICDLCKDFVEKKSAEEPEFKQHLAELLQGEESDYLKKVHAVSDAGYGKNGIIRILPSGHINRAYWENLSKRDWMDFCIRPRDKDKSLLRFFCDFLQPILVDLGYDYLLIDSRAGITQYSKVARHISERLAVIFCPNEEAKSAIVSGLLPMMVDSHLEKITFIISRIPPELHEKKEEVFEEMVKLIDENIPAELSTNRETLKLHADIATQLESNKRLIDERYLTGRNGEIVPMNEDILRIFIELCPEEIPLQARNMSLKDQANAVWHEIYRKNIDNIVENRVFRIVKERGEILNIDGSRNVAFRVKTYVGLLDNFYQSFFDIADGDVERCIRSLNRTLYDAGVSCGDAFGEGFVALDTYIKAPGESNKTKNIEQWCRFDTEAGFGKMSYKNENSEKILSIENLFIMARGTTTDYTAFFTGYVIGVLKVILKPHRLKALSMARIDETGECIESFMDVYKDGEISIYPILGSSNLNYGILYKIVTS
jgi:MinD-like ATPase involved in chromosome partitioning or flagellar assembly